MKLIVQPWHKCWLPGGKNFFGRCRNQESEVTEVSVSLCQIRRRGRSKVSLFTNSFNILQRPHLHYQALLVHPASRFWVIRDFKFGVERELYSRQPTGIATQPWEDLPSEQKQALARSVWWQQSGVLPRGVEYEETWLAERILGDLKSRLCHQDTLCEDCWLSEDVGVFGVFGVFGFFSC